MLAMRVLFCSCLRKVCSCVSEALSRGGSRIECRGVLSIPRALALAKFYVLRPL